jgi:tellurite resistance protein
MSKNAKQATRSGASPADSRVERYREMNNQLSVMYCEVGEFLQAVYHELKKMPDRVKQSEYGEKLDELKRRLECAEDELDVAVDLAADARDLATERAARNARRRGKRSAASA